MAGYSGTPLAKKLGIKEGFAVAASNAPAGFAKLLGELPIGVTLAKQVAKRETYDVLVVFVDKRKDLAAAVKSLRANMKPATGLWIAWPKKSSGVPTDITEDVIREVALPTGLVDNKVCAIDDTWSGLRLVIRLANR